MPIIPLQQPQFEYDEDNNTLIVTLTEAPPPDEQDPASWQPGFVRVVTVALPKAPERKPIE